MKSLLLFLSLLCATATFGQFVPPAEDRISVTTDEDGVLVAPDTFWTANDASIYSALELTSAATGDAAGLTSGILPAERLNGATGVNEYLMWSGFGYVWRTFANVRSDIGANNADNITLGTLSDDRLSGNVALRNASNSFSSSTWFRGPVTLISLTEPYGSGVLWTGESDTLTWDNQEVLVHHEIVDVDRNEDKLDLENIRPGQRVRITGEGGRIEMYLGESEEFTGSIVVSGAGTSGVNGLYDEDGTTGGKPRYTLQGGTTNDDSIYWADIYWIMLSGGVVQYQSTQDVATPDLATTWTVNLGDTPVPAVAAETATLGPEAAVNWVTLTEGGRRLPLFFIPIPWSSGFTDFELKASVSNFTGASVADRFKYIYHSPDPNLAESMYDVKPLVWFTRSGPTGVIEHRQQPANASIFSTLPDDAEVGGVYVLVRGDAAWMYEGNPDLLWAYVLFGSLDPNEDILNRQIWSPVRPEWISPSKIPSFLDTGD